MNETEWNTCSDVQQLLDFVRSKATERKLRLFACAATRQVWEDLIDQRSRTCVELAERYADGERDHHALEIAEREAVAALNDDWDAALSESMLAPNVYASALAVSAANLELKCWDNSGPPPGVYVPPIVDCLRSVKAERSKAVVALLHCLFGNPLRPVVLDPNWRTSRAVAIATRMYESRDFSALPTLADALQDAGCDNADILNHCRGPGPHVRGCWAVDLVLGRE